jgi:hypothetical protein
VRHISTDVLVAGVGSGGVAAAYAACRLGARVVLTEESPWLGGRLTTQAVPPDENIVDAVVFASPDSNARQVVSAKYVLAATDAGLEPGSAVFDDSAGVGSHRIDPHPVEGNTGEAAGALVAFRLRERTAQRAVHDAPSRRQRLQSVLSDDLGVPLAWPDAIRTSPGLPIGSTSRLQR